MEGDLIKVCETRKSVYVQKLNQLMSKLFDGSIIKTILGYLFFLIEKSNFALARIESRAS